LVDADGEAGRVTGAVIQTVVFASGNLEAGPAAGRRLVIVSGAGLTASGTATSVTVVPSSSGQ